MILPLFLMLCMNIGGCYRYPLWHFAAYDARRMFQVVSVGWLAGDPSVLGFSTRTASFSLLLIGWLHSLFLLAIPRMWLRMRKERGRRPAADFGSQGIGLWRGTRWYRTSRVDKLWLGSSAIYRFHR